MKKIDKLIEDFLNTGRFVTEQSLFDDEDTILYFKDKIKTVVNNIMKNLPSDHIIEVETNDESFVLFKYNVGENIYTFTLVNNISEDSLVNAVVSIKDGMGGMTKQSTFRSNIDSDDYFKKLTKSLKKVIKFINELREKVNNRLKYVKSVGPLVSFGDEEQSKLFTTPAFTCVANFLETDIRKSDKKLINIFKRLGDNYDTNREYYDKLLNKICNIINTKQITPYALYSKLMHLDLHDDIDLEEKIKQSKSQLYELSFCKCNNEYFRDCNANSGQKSTLMKNAMSTLKDLIDSDKEVYGENGCIEEFYNKIVEGDGRKISKHDIFSNKPIKLDGVDMIIQPDLGIEVKRENKTDFIFSEFFSLYKNEPNRSNYNTPEKFERYNQIISGVVDKLNNSKEGNDILSEFDTTGGIFLKDYMFYPKEHYRLYWSDYSERAQLLGEKRMTVRFEITGDGYKWIEGNCNLQQNEDYISEYVENFLDL